MAQRRKRLGRATSKARSAPGAGAKGSPSTENRQPPPRPLRRSLPFLLVSVVVYAAWFAFLLYLVMRGS